jgi:hypothetical protein
MTKLNHPAIQCAADAVTAEEYDIWIGTRLYRVTAYNHADATEAAMEHDRNRLEQQAEAKRDEQAELL